MTKSFVSGSISENTEGNGSADASTPPRSIPTNAHSASDRLREPLLDSPVASHTIDIQGDARTEAFVHAIHDKVKLPARLTWSHVPKALFAGASAAAGSFLYAMGGAKLGINYEVGGIGINIPQNLYYGTGAAEFFYESYSNFKNIWGRCIAATTLGVAATLPSAIASYKFSDGGWFGYVQTGLTFFGNLPLNIYGMYDSIKRPLDYKNDNPRVRAFLVEEYRKGLPEEYVNILSEADRSLATVLASRMLGVTLGTGLVAAQTGYICSSSKFLGDLVKNEGVGVALGVLANSPTLLIAFLMSGFDLAKDSVELSADIYRHFTGDKKVPLTDGDKTQIAAFATIFAGCAYMAYYSSATSQLLYDDSCPSFGNPLSEILRDSSIDGSAVFNQIMTSKAFMALLRYLKMAYDTNEESRNIYRIRMTDLFLKASGSRAELEEIALAHFPERIAEWQKTVPATPVESAEPTAKTSYFSSVTNFFSRKKPADLTAPAPQAEVNTTNTVAPKGYSTSFLSAVGYQKLSPTATIAPEPSTAPSFSHVASQSM